MGAKVGTHLQRKIEDLSLQHIFILFWFWIIYFVSIIYLSKKTRVSNNSPLISPVKPSVLKPPTAKTRPGKPWLTCERHVHIEDHGPQYKRPKPLCIIISSLKLPHSYHSWGLWKVCSFFWGRVNTTPKKQNIFSHYKPSEKSQSCHSSNSFKLPPSNYEFSFGPCPREGSHLPPWQK